MDMKLYEGKKIFVKLNSDRFYQGFVLEVVYMGRDNSDVDVWMFTIRDKFENLLSFSNKEIKFIEEEKK